MANDPPSSFSIVNSICRHVAGSGSMASARSASLTCGLRASTRSPTRMSRIGFVSYLVTLGAGRGVLAAISGREECEVPENPCHKNPPANNRQPHIQAMPSFERALRLVVRVVTEGFEMANIGVSVSGVSSNAVLVRDED